MVLGYLLYEVVDLGVNVIKIGYNGSRATYYWWYGIAYPEVQRDTLEVERLTNRLEKLELLLKDKED
jgi:hypothetical protein|tara:strand:- start:585 stop:785 length:201 start_codon:yes stop_codon:yes gene_type:complete